MDIDDINLDEIAAAQLLAGNQVFAHQQNFILFTKQHSDGARLGVDAAHLRADDLVDLVGKVFVNRVALRLTDALQNHLLGGLRGNTTEIVGRAGHAYNIA